MAPRQTRETSRKARSSKPTAGPRHPETPAADSFERVRLVRAQSTDASVPAGATPAHGKCIAVASEGLRAQPRRGEDGWGAAVPDAPSSAGSPVAATEIASAGAAEAGAEIASVAPAA